MGLLDTFTSKVSKAVQTVSEKVQATTMDASSVQSEEALMSKMDVEAAEVASVAETEDAACDADVDFFMEFAEVQMAKVTADVLNVRPTPSTNEARIGTLKRGTEVSIHAVCDDWLKIDFESREAYIFGAYTDFEKPEMTVTATSLNVRKAPGTESDKVGSLPNGTVVKVIGEKSGWAKILYKNRIGYVSKEYLQ